METTKTQTTVPPQTAASHHNSTEGAREKFSFSEMGLIISPKLSIGSPDDPLEREADDMADKVMRMEMPEPISFSQNKNSVSRKCAHCEEEEKKELNRKESSSEQVSEAPSIVHDALNSPGTSMDAGTRSFMETRFNYDFSDVKIHDGDIAAKSADSINALAYTSGNNIVFNSGQYNTNSDPGKRLLAHELTHVVQQNVNVQTKKIQRQMPPGSSQATPDPAAGIPSMLRYLIEWQVAGLLDPPFRPSWVAPIPAYTLTQEQASRVSTAGVTAVIAGITARASAAETAAGVTRTGTTALEIAAQRWGTAAVIEGGAGAGAATGSAVLSRLGALAGEAAVPLTIAAILLTPTSTAPAWMDEISQITGEPYSSPEDYSWQRRLNPQQEDYLRYLARARRIAPSPTIDDEPEDSPQPLPQPLPQPDPEEPGGCVSRNVPRRGGHVRHDAYATRVTGSTSDYFVWPGIPYLGINYDGLSAPRRVWEVKVGHGWFFNPAMGALRDRVLARWDAQKNLGLSVAAQCGYVHLWSIPDRYVAALLLFRWGGIPPVLSIPE